MLLIIMSLRAVLETVIHLESFRNIDLFFQGIYYTRFRIHTKKKSADFAGGRNGKNGGSNGAGDAAASTTNTAGDGRAANGTASGNAAAQSTSADQIEYAQPYCSYVSHYQQEKAAKSAKQGPDHHNLMPAQIVDD